MRGCTNNVNVPRRYEYVQRLNDARNDRVCALKTLCNAMTQRGMYEKVAAVDSVRFDRNGTDSVCANYSTCPDGHFRWFHGNDTHDAVCRKCPPGTYRNATDFGEDYQACRECPDGSFSSQEGATRCLPCTNCLLEGSLIEDPALRQCPFSPSAQHCVRGYKTLCTPDRNSTCMVCPALGLNGGYRMGDLGLCAPCKNGYYYNESDPVPGRRCVPCAPGFYCPSKEQVYECQVGTLSIPMWLDVFWLASESPP